MASRSEQTSTRLQTYKKRYSDAVQNYEKEKTRIQKANITERARRKQLKRLNKETNDLLSFLSANIRTNTDQLQDEREAEKKGITAADVRYERTKSVQKEARRVRELERQPTRPTTPEARRARAARIVNQYGARQAMSEQIRGSRVTVGRRESTITAATRSPNVMAAPGEPKEKDFEVQGIIPGAFGGLVVRDKKSYGGSRFADKGTSFRSFLAPTEVSAGIEYNYRQKISYESAQRREQYGSSAAAKQIIGFNRKLDKTRDSFGSYPGKSNLDKAIDGVAKTGLEVFGGSGNVLMGVNSVIIADQPMRYVGGKVASGGLFIRDILKGASGNPAAQQRTIQRLTDIQTSQEREIKRRGTGGYLAMIAGEFLVFEGLGRTFEFGLRGGASVVGSTSRQVKSTYNILTEGRQSRLFDKNIAKNIERQEGRIAFEGGIGVNPKKPLTAPRPYSVEFSPKSTKIKFSDDIEIIARREPPPPKKPSVTPSRIARDKRGSYRGGLAIRKPQKFREPSLPENVKLEGLGGEISGGSRGYIGGGSRGYIGGGSRIGGMPVTGIIRGITYGTGISINTGRYNYTGPNFRYSNNLRFSQNTGSGFGTLQPQGINQKQSQDTRTKSKSSFYSPLAIAAVGGGIGAYSINRFFNNSLKEIQKPPKVGVPARPKNVFNGFNFGYGQRGRKTKRYTPSLAVALGAFKGTNLRGKTITGLEFRGF